MAKITRILQLFPSLVATLHLAIATSVISFDNDKAPEVDMPQEYHFQGERVVTDILSLYAGVDVDYKYNQTYDEGEGKSAPGCPKAVEGRPWVHYGKPSKCFLVGFRGPCGWGKRMFHLANSNNGVCNCDCFSEPPPVPLADYSLNEITFNSISYPQMITFYPVNNLIFGRKKRDLPNENGKAVTPPSASPTINPIKGKRTRSGAVVIDSENILQSKKTPLGTYSKTQYQFCYSPSFQRQAVFDPVQLECHPFLDQGPCAEGEWLVRNAQSSSNQIYCEKRKCPKYSGTNTNPNSGGGFTYFDYLRQECLTEVYGSLRESFFTHTNGILSRNSFCQQAGMKYSPTLKSCVRDISSKLKFRVLG